MHEDRPAQLRSWLATEVVPAASALAASSCAAPRTGWTRTCCHWSSRCWHDCTCCVDDDVLDLAGTLAPPALRSLDALHVATALRSGVDVLVTYDQRTAEAARGAGVRTLAP